MNVFTAKFYLYIPDHAPHRCHCVIMTSGRQTGIAVEIEGIEDPRRPLPVGKTIFGANTYRHPKDADNLDVAFKIAFRRALEFCEVTSEPCYSNGMTGRKLNPLGRELYRAFRVAMREGPITIERMTSVEY